MANKVNKSKAEGSDRLVSLDALRGFDMFWIIGGERLVHYAAKLTDHPWLQVASEQLEHTKWNGFTFYDLIFPLFLFIAGVAMPLSMASRRKRGFEDRDLAIGVIRRGALLVFLGMVYNGLLNFEFESLRYASVLGRIGLAYMLAGLIVLRTEARGQMIWTAGLLLFYWVALTAIPVPDIGAGVLEPGKTFTDFIDRAFTPGVLYHGDRDPEGLFGTIPAVATALLGAMAGRILLLADWNGWQKTLSLCAMGSACLAIGYAWDFAFPINKNLWSSSFVMWCAGYSALLLAAFYLVIDVLRFRIWAALFVIIGVNSITIYLGQKVFDFEYTARFLFQGVVSLAPEARQPLILMSFVLLLKLGFLTFLHRKKVYLRV